MRMTCGSNRPRLVELDTALNLDGKGQPQPEQVMAKSAPAFGAGPS